MQTGIASYPDGICFKKIPCNSWQNPTHTYIVVRNFLEYAGFSMFALLRCLETRIGLDLVILAWCWISGRIIRYALPDNPVFSCRISGWIKLVRRIYGPTLLWRKLQLPSGFVLKEMCSMLERVVARLGESNMPTFKQVITYIACNQ